MVPNTLPLAFWATKMKLYVFLEYVFMNIWLYFAKQDPEKAIVEWVEKMFADRRNSPSASPDFTPLHMAIYKQHPEVARLLIEKGANVNKKDHFGLTPFMLSALRSKFLICYHIV